MHFNRELVAKNFGFKSEEAYYDESSSHRFIHLIKTPTLFIHAEDDLIVQNVAVDYDAISKNPNTILARTPSGGHTAYHESLFDT